MSTEKTHAAWPTEREKRHILNDVCGLAVNIKTISASRRFGAEQTWGRLERIHQAIVKQKDDEIERLRDRIEILESEIEANALGL